MNVLTLNNNSYTLRNIAGVWMPNNNPNLHTNATHVIGIDTGGGSWLSK